MGDKRKNLKVNKNCGSVQKTMNVEVWQELRAHSREVFLGCDTVFLGKWFGVF